MTFPIVKPYPVLVRNRNQALLLGPVILPDLLHHRVIPVRNLAVNLERKSGTSPDSKVWHTPRLNSGIRKTVRALGEVIPHFS